tara:strand:+ start:439 stop:735 length:297 start_codon:yes stop_codon:yes gene_type:complete
LIQSHSPPPEQEIALFAWQVHFFDLKSPLMMVPPNLQQLQVGGGGCVVVYVEQALPLAHSVSPHMHAAALNLEPSVVSQFSITTVPQLSPEKPAWHWH